MPDNVIPLDPHPRFGMAGDRDEIADALDAARARDFTEVLVLGYRDGAPQLVEAICTTADAEFLRLLAVAFRKLLAAGAYPDTLHRRLDPRCLHAGLEPGADDGEQAGVIDHQH